MNSILVRLDFLLAPPLANNTDWITVQSSSSSFAKISGSWTTFGRCNLEQPASMQAKLLYDETYRARDTGTDRPKFQSTCVGFIFYDCTESEDFHYLRPL